MACTASFCTLTEQVASKRLDLQATLRVSLQTTAVDQIVDQAPHVI